MDVTTFAMAKAYVDEKLNNSDSGGEKFYINIEGDFDTFTADKSLSEIITAAEEDKDCVIDFLYDNSLHIMVPLRSFAHNEFQKQAIFSTVANIDNTDLFLQVICTDLDGDTWRTYNRNLFADEVINLNYTISIDEQTGDITATTLSKYSEILQALTSSKTLMVKCRGDFIGQTANVIAVNSNDFTGIVTTFTLVVDGSPIFYLVAHSSDDTIFAYTSQQ